jgi:3-hydroxybutyryl-CoA dehydrogenase
MNQVDRLDKAAVIGAGLMGTQIGVVLSKRTGVVFLMSRHEESLQRAIRDARSYLEQLHQHGFLQGQSPESVLSRIRLTQRLPEALSGAELVVESIPERLPAKQALFSKIEEIVSPRCLLASNTSSLPISMLAESMEHPGRMAGSHFFQPAHIVPVVEVISGKKTDMETVDRLIHIWKGLGKLPLKVSKDVPGFLINRIQHALIREAVRLLSQGVASVEDIDLAVRAALGPRFCTTGPLEQRDLNGLEMHRTVAEHLWKSLDGWQEPLGYLNEIVEQGNTGIESGKGFYDWRGKDPSAVRRRKNESLLQVYSWMERYWKNDQNDVID